MPPSANTIRWGDECARAGPWRTDGLVAFLAPVANGSPPSAEFVRRCLRLLAEQGFQWVVTGALSPQEQAGFLEAGFAVYERLHLLLLDGNAALPVLPPGPRLRRASFHRAGVLEVDGAAFSPFWRLDRAGLKEALEATPRRRFRVALGPGRHVTGYAICGVSGGRGFVQRLAVAPSAQSRGIGKRLLVDGLQWMKALGTREVAVNTQKGNDAALNLYRRVGFRDDPAGLSVLSASLTGADLSEFVGR